MRSELRTALRLVALFVFCACSIAGQAPQPHADKDPAFAEGPGVTVASLTHAVPASLPDDPVLKSEKHVTAVLVIIGADGALKKLYLTNKTPSGFDQAAIAAVRQSQFEAGSLKGKPVPTRLLIWVPFFGDDRPALPVTDPGLPGKKSTWLKGLTPPWPRDTPYAEFSDAARQAHIESATVIFRVLIDEEGKLHVVNLLQRAGWGLDENAFAAVRRYTFKPATLEGIPVPYLMSIEVIFHRSVN